METYHNFSVSLKSILKIRKCCCLFNISYKESSGATWIKVIINHGPCMWTVTVTMVTGIVSIIYRKKPKKLLPLLSSGLDKKGIPLVLWASNSCILNTWDHFLLHVVLVNLLSPNIHIQILQTGLYTFLWRISWEYLIKDQSIFPQVITFLILTTYSLDCVLVSLGENWVNSFKCGWLAWPLAHKQGFH